VLTIDSVTGDFAYTPDADFNGTDSFSYQITDADGDTDTANVSINVTNVNDDPTVLDLSHYETGTTITGTNIWGTSERSYINQDGETINFDGVSRIITGSGNDTFQGGYVRHQISNIDMGAGDDQFNLATFDGIQLDISAGAGDDTVWVGGRMGTGFAGLMNGHVIGGEGFDTLKIEGEIDNLSFSHFGGGAQVTDGVKTVTFDEIEVLRSGRGDDHFTGYIDKDIETIFMGDGDDTYSAFTMLDQQLNVDAGKGDDTVTIGGHPGSGGTGVLTGHVEGGAGTDTLRAGLMARGEHGDALKLTINADGTSGTVGYENGQSAEASFSGFEHYEFASSRANPVNDQLVDATATSVDLTLNTLNGHDSILSGSGDDTLIGGNGDDIIGGGSGNDVIDGGTGTDTVIMEGSVVNYMFGSYTYIRIHDAKTGVGGDNQVSNFERLKFDEGDFAWQRGNNANNNMTAVDDTGTIMVGLHGSDTLTGHDGDDVLIGDNGANFTWQNGQDVLNGGAGDDTLIGNGGADTFVFEGLHGHDTIADFEIGVDTLDVTGLAGFHSAWWPVEDRDVYLEVADGDTKISFNDQSITLIGVDFRDGYASPSQFAADNIIWTPEVDILGDPLI
jgi:Ca2+-binding RTX toxin-like protein